MELKASKELGAINATLSTLILNGIERRYKYSVQQACQCKLILNGIERAYIYKGFSSDILLLILNGIESFSVSLYFTENVI